MSHRTTYKFRIERQGKRKTIEIRRPARPVRPEPMIPPLARRIALAHLLEAAVCSGAVADFADAARRLGITRARVSQLVLLLGLSPRIVERILCNAEQVSERALRPIASEHDWKTQERLFAEGGR